MRRAIVWTSILVIMIGIPILVGVNLNPVPESSRRRAEGRDRYILREDDPWERQREERQRRDIQDGNWVFTDWREVEPGLSHRYVKDEGLSICYSEFKGEGIRSISPVPCITWTW